VEINLISINNFKTKIGKFKKRLRAQKLGAGLWAGLLSCYCQLELEVTIPDVVNL
jgi:hypothetical protein